MDEKHLYTLRVQTATWRRTVLLCLVCIPTFVASGFMSNVLPHKGNTPLELAIVIVFTVLFGWISMGFWTALVGFFTLIVHPEYYRAAQAIHPPSGPLPRTAVLMPICNEQPARVFAGLSAVYQSLEKTGSLEHFDFFVLSDTSDPDLWVEEELAWARSCTRLNAAGRLFYRRRKVNLKRKSGNIADFCRRWGNNYAYMIVLDADSIMAGPTLINMVGIMEQNPHVGILQTVPRGFGRDSLIARLQQFSNNVYGPIFAAGLHFWQLGDAHFWGHNAILRVAPFMKHCALPRLSGKPPLGGDILSHDFVEAALMRRAGWAVWLAHHLEGSYEEMPPTLLDDLKRDRRWCQGNLQHLRLLFKEGLCPAHRAMFLNGAMAYGSALLWFIFLGLCSAEALYKALGSPDYFPETRTLFPSWPVWHPEWSIMLLAATAVILFLPKILSTLLIMRTDGGYRSYGGFRRLVLSVLVEILCSALCAPVRMLFHSKFVFLTMLGRQVGWGNQQREDGGTPWGQAVRFHAGGTLLGLLWGLVVFVVNRTFFWWISPVLFPLVLSIPLSVWSSRAATGRAFRRRGVLVIPEERDPPLELRLLKDNLEQLNKPDPELAVRDACGFVRAVVEPSVNAQHILLLRTGRTLSQGIAARRKALQEKAVCRGPASLCRSEKMELLSDPSSMASLHRAVWDISDRAQAARWCLTR